MSKKLKVIKRKGATFDTFLFLGKRFFIICVIIINNGLFFIINDAFIDTGVNGYLFINILFIKRITQLL